MIVRILLRCWPRLQWMTPSSRPTAVNAAMARSSCSSRESGGHLRADARLALGHHREGEADDVDAASSSCIGHAAGERSVAEHHRNDRVLAGLQGRSRRASRPARKWRAFSNRRVRSSGCPREGRAPRRLDAGDHRRDAVGEEIGARALAQPLDDLLARGDVTAAGAAECLAERAGEDVDRARRRRSARACRARVAPMKPVACESSTMTRAS